MPQISKEQIEQAIEALNTHPDHDTENVNDEAVAMLQSLLDQPEGKPVCYEYQAKSGLWFPFTDQRHQDNTIADGTYPIRPLYTHPPAPRKPITAEMVTAEMIDAYLTAQRATVEEADRTFGRPNAGGLHTNTMRGACCAGIVAAVNAYLKENL
jgi:hypothetical protein